MRRPLPQALLARWIESRHMGTGAAQPVLTAGSRPFWRENGFGGKMPAEPGHQTSLALAASGWHVTQPGTASGAQICQAIALIATQLRAENSRGPEGQATAVVQLFEGSLFCLRLLCSRPRWSSPLDKRRFSMEAPQGGKEWDWVAPALKFKVLATAGKARVGRLELPHFTCETPMFMPVGTQGTVKGLTTEQLEQLECHVNWETRTTSGTGQARMWWPTWADSTNS